MANKLNYKIAVSGAADVKHCCSDIERLSEEIGKEIVEQGCDVITGATTGAPYFAARGAKKARGTSIGFSPASSEREHLKKYKLPIDQFDLIIYTGFDYIGRNLILTKAADGVIIVCGRIGTLNEFTIAFESRVPIGVLKGSGGTADLIDEVLKRGRRAPTKIVSDTEPKKLVQKLIKEIQKVKRSR